jgi:gliding motility-associated-like protein
VGNVNTDYVSYFRMRVFNRWGQEVFHGTNAKQGWDGKTDGNAAPDGVYYYIIDISYEVVGCHGELIGARTVPTETGWVQILR